jgi:Cell wall-active antibiotics response 4TMS YvqF/Domain of unknown function (DUF5668)
MMDDARREEREEARQALREARRQRRERKRLRRKAENNPWTRLVAGMAILAVGVIAWLDRLDRLDANDFLSWWALILIALGLANLPQRRWVAAGVWLILGLIFLPPLPFLPHFRLVQLLGLWPLMISAGGVSLVRQALSPAAKDLPGGSGFHAFAWMGGNVRKIGAEDFQGGDAVVVMGGCEIDLTNAHITREAVIDLLAFWGGIEIRVPRNWIIENHLNPLLGGIVVKAANPTEGEGPRLVLRGSAIMGGIEIRNGKEVAA